MHEIFRKLSHSISSAAGKPIAFISALLLIIVWLITGPVFNFSDTWQLVINTTTTIITFLMVFLIQNTQNRDTKAMNLKLDELILHMKNARNKLIDLEDMDDNTIDAIEKQFDDMRKKRELKTSTIAKK